MLEILNAPPESRAAELGLCAGDVIISINGNEIHDVIDFSFFAAHHRIRLRVKKKAGGIQSISFIKEPDHALGLELAPLVVKRCRNRCIFCFVDQMPLGCRKTLYVKDDDFRASFLYGNFITLGALTDPDWDRIFKQRLSPLYISVHTTDHRLRSTMLRNKRSPDILSSLKRLAAGGITMHTQIVLCPGINDGEHLIKTINDLSGLFPAVSSVAVVPVGVTGSREGLFPLSTFSKREAGAVLALLEPMRKMFKRRYGTRLVFASDEFYIKAGMPFPPFSAYEDFHQIENGVGMVASFMKEVSRTRVPKKILPVKATLVTGVSFSGILRGLMPRLRSMENAGVRLVAAENRFFGRSVTVSGLLTGGDIVQALIGKRLGDIVVVPSNALKEDEDLFLDGMSLKDLEQSLDVKIFKSDGFSELVTLLAHGGRIKP